jgi:serine O-acetyltransferase
MFRELRNLILDLDNYAYRLKLPRCCIVFMPFLFPATWAIIQYRLSRIVLYHFRIPVLQQLLRVYFFITGRLVNILTGIEISSRAVIGGGMYLPHLGTIIIAHQTVIGQFAVIHQEVTFGNAAKEGKMVFPVLGDRVYVGAGAKIIGNVKIGNDVMIGCNAVVVKDIPDHATAVGMPARVVNMDGSEGSIFIRLKKKG